MNKQKLVFWSAVAALGVAMSLFANPVNAQENASEKGASQQTVNKRVTMSLENADLRYALKLLFQAAEVSYSLDQSVQGTVTASLTDVPFKIALESILRSTQSQMPLTYRVEDGIYIVTPKLEERSEKIDIIGGGQDLPPAKRTVRIHLNFADAIDIARALGGGVIESRFSRETGGMGSNGRGNGAGMGSGFGTGFGSGMGMNGFTGSGFNGFNGMNGMNGSNGFNGFNGSGSPGVGNPGGRGR